VTDKTTETSALTYRDSDGATREVKGCTLTVDHLDRHWIWSEQLQINLVYKCKGRENALIGAIASLLFTIKLQGVRIAELERIADLAQKFANEVNPPEELL